MHTFYRKDDEIDVIYIVLPNGMHHEYTIRGAEAGKHILCEEPMANSAQDCREMIEACEKADRKLAIGYRCPFEPHHQHCIELARQEAFGKGNIQFDQVDHFAAEMDAFARHLLFEEPNRVPGQEGLRDLNAIEAIYRSIQSGKSQDVASIG